VACQTGAFWFVIHWSTSAPILTIIPRTDCKDRSWAVAGTLKTHWHFDKVPVLFGVSSFTVLTIAEACGVDSVLNSLFTNIVSGVRITARFGPVPTL